MTDVHVVYVDLVVLVMHAKHVDILDGLRHDYALGLVTLDEVILLLAVDLQVPGSKYRKYFEFRELFPKCQAH